MVVNKRLVQTVRFWVWLSGFLCYATLQWLMFLSRECRCDSMFCCYTLLVAVMLMATMCREVGRLSASPSCTHAAGSSLSLLPSSAAASLFTESHCSLANHHHRTGLLCIALTYDHSLPEQQLPIRLKTFFTVTCYAVNKLCACTLHIRPVFHSLPEPTR